MSVLGVRCSHFITQAKPADSVILRVTRERKKGSRMSQQAIPIIDFAQNAATVGQAVREAYATIGFMYAVNLLNEFEARDRVFAEAMRFFKLSQADKDRCSWTSKATNRGYIGIERENVDPSAPGDLKEAYNMGREGDPAYANPWPEALPAFREAMQAFYSACLRMSDRVLEIFEVGLSLPEGFLRQRHDIGESNILRVLHYPPLTDLHTVIPGQLRAGAHTDSGTHTLLLQDQIGGLEVQHRDGAWIPAPSVPQAVLINSGDLLARWTNDIFCSTRHRVMLPLKAGQNRSRYSLVFFCHPNDATEIRCLDACESPEHPAKYPPIDAKAYLL
jgi:isopenicillin N synthase-like dioxygenase